MAGKWKNNAKIEIELKFENITQTCKQERYCDSNVKTYLVLIPPIFIMWFDGNRTAL